MAKHLSNADIVFKIVLGVFGVVISALTLNLNWRLGDLSSRLDADKFSLEQITNAYDRVDSYLALDANAQGMKQRGAAIILYVEQITDKALSAALWNILKGEAADPDVRDAATDIALGDVVPPDRVDDSKFATEFKFASNEGGRSTAWVFLCPNPKDLAKTVSVATTIGEALGKMNAGADRGRQFGIVAGGRWQEELVPTQGQITYVLDPDEVESTKGADMQKTVDAVAGEVPKKVVPNSGKLSLYLYSIIVCL